jgi:hypothetical protein
LYTLEEYNMVTANRHMHCVLQAHHSPVRQGRIREALDGLQLAFDDSKVSGRITQVLGMTDQVQVPVAGIVMLLAAASKASGQVYNPESERDN